MIGIKSSKLKIIQNMSSRVFNIDLSEAIPFLINKLGNYYSNECLNIVQYIAMNIITSVLDNDKLSGTNAECFNDAVDYLTQLNIGTDDSYGICSDLTDLIVSLIVVHIQDYDHPKYLDNLTYEIKDNLNVRICLAKGILNGSMGL